MGGEGIEFRGLTKRFGGFTAVDDLTCTVEPGRITGFLGPNGAGKTTTLRMLMQLVRPTSGTALIGGAAYDQLPHPLQTVGAALEATNFHPGRTGRDHLRVLAATHSIPDSRVDELIGLVGLTEFGNRRAGGYSLGMRQRLALAAALLGDPEVLLLDEPANGLDPEGIRWLRGFLRHLSDDAGKTILISSHLLEEVERTVDDVLIIARGRLVKSGRIADISGGGGAYVRTSDPEALVGELGRAGLTGRREGPDGVFVDGAELRAVGEAAHRAGVPVWELSRRRPDLEDLFFQLTEGHGMGGAA